MRKRWWIVLAVPAFVLFVAVGGAIVELLWNWLLPSIFGWHQITFWQAVGLLALCRILFGGLGPHGHDRPGWHRHRLGRCQDMTPEERQRLREAVYRRCGFGPSAGENANQNQ